MQRIPCQGDFWHAHRAALAAGWGASALTRDRSTGRGGPVARRDPGHCGSPECVATASGAQRVPASRMPLPRACGTASRSLQPVPLDRGTGPWPSRKVPAPAGALRTPRRPLERGRECVVFWSEAEPENRRCGIKVLRASCAVLGNYLENSLPTFFITRCDRIPVDLALRLVALHRRRELAELGGFFARRWIGLQDNRRVCEAQHKPHATRIVLLCHL